MCGACSRATFKYKRSTRSTPAAPAGKSQLLSTKIVREVHSHSSGSTCAEQLAQSHLRRATCAEQLAQSNCTKHLRRATCTDQLAQSTCAKRLHAATGAEHLLRALAQSNLHRAHAQSACTEQLAQSNLHRPTCTEHMRKALAQSNWRRALAQSNLLRALAQSNLHRALACSSVQQLAESNLRAAAWNNAACADHFREKSRGAVREESRMMRWSSHVTIHTEHRRAQTRSPQRCKKVSPRLDERLWKNAFGPIVL